MVEKIQATLKQVMEYFQMKTKEFRDEWEKLSDDEKEYYREAIGEAVNDSMK